jgi:hypothetical protein
MCVSNFVGVSHRALLFRLVASHGPHGRVDGRWYVVGGRWGNEKQGLARISHQLLGIGFEGD